MRFKLPSVHLSYLKLPRAWSKSSKYVYQHTCRPIYHQTFHSTSHPNYHSKTNDSMSQKGFTLIEVMVALAILAVIAVAANRASGSYLRSIDTLKTRTLAHFVVQNTVADLRMQPRQIDTTLTQQVSMQGREWQITLTPQDIQESIPLASQGYDDIQSQYINVQVAPIIDGQVKNSVTDMSVLLAKPDN